jgi:hypothetical protein
MSAVVGGRSCLVSASAKMGGARNQRSPEKGKREEQKTKQKQKTTGTLTINLHHIALHQSLLQLDQTSLNDALELSFRVPLDPADRMRWCGGIESTPRARAEEGRDSVCARVGG